MELYPYCYYEFIPIRRWQIWHLKSIFMQFTWKEYALAVLITAHATMQTVYFVCNIWHDNLSRRRSSQQTHQIAL